MVTPRRDFLQQLLAAGALTTGASVLSACASGAAAVSTAPTSSSAGNAAAAPAPRTQWDMSWTKRLGKYKTAYDSPEIYAGAALSYAQASTEGYEMAVHPKASEVTPVLILRHRAAVMTLNDAMWARLDLGTARTLKDPTTGEPAKRNPFINYVKGDKFSMIDGETGLDTLITRGAIVLACARALSGAAYQLRQKEPKLTADAAKAEIFGALIPGVYAMPNGIFAVSAAQDAGCHYMRVLA